MISSRQPSSSRRHLVLYTRGRSDLLDLLTSGLEVGRGAAASKVLGKHWLHEAAENDLGTIGLWESHPEDSDKFEGKVEWEPVDGIDGALKNGQESIDHPVR